MPALFVAVTGFLGAGKTTTVARLARYLTERGERVAVVTNDQGESLVDTAVVAQSVAEVGEVTGGCFCCRFEDLLTVVVPLADRYDVVLAEAVGSCTDLQATVVRPLQKYHGERFRVAPLLAVVDPDRLAELTRRLQDDEDDLAYLFEKQLADADVIAVNKSDTGPAVRRRAVINALRQTYDDAAVVDVSAMTGAGFDELVGLLSGTPDPARSLTIDYDRYGRAEADLAWLDLTADIESDVLDGRVWGGRLLGELSQRAAGEGWTVGHVKVLVSGADGEMTKLSLTAAGGEPSVDTAGAVSRGGRAVINARVACLPAELDEAVAAAVRVADGESGCRSVLSGPRAFQPGYPRPTHRIAAVGE